MPVFFCFASQWQRCAIVFQTCRALLEVCGKMLKKSFFPEMLLVRWTKKHTKHGTLLCPNGQPYKKKLVLLRCKEGGGGGGIWFSTSFSSLCERMRIATTWKPRWTRVTLAIRRDLKRVRSCWSISAWSRSSSAWFGSWSWSLPLKVEAICSTKKTLKETVLQSLRESSEMIITTSHDRLLVTRARHWRLDWKVLSFPGLFIFSQWSRASLNAVVLRLGPCWCFSPTCRCLDVHSFQQHCCEGKGKQRVTTIGVEPWESTFKSAWLHCADDRGAYRLQRKSLHWLLVFHLSTVSRVCGMSPMSAIKFIIIIIIIITILFSHH